LTVGLPLAGGIGRKRKQSQVTGAFDGAGHFSLVLGAGAGLAAGADLSVFGNVTPEQLGLLVIYDNTSVGAEGAYPRVGVKTLPTGAALLFICRCLIAHDSYSWFSLGTENLNS
jgi:hypothetical protein